MLEFTINMPDSETPNPVAIIRILSEKEFHTEAIIFGYTPVDPREERGMTFNTQCDKTAAKMSIIFINAEKLELCTLIHEIRHAYFWNTASPTGALPCNVYNDVGEEAFCSRLDTLINRAVCTIESSTGKPMKWKVI